MAKDKVEAGKAQLVRNFVQRRAVDGVDEELTEGIHPDWLQVERIIAQRTTVRGLDYLVKCALPAECFLAFSFCRRTADCLCSSSASFCSGSIHPAAAELAISIMRGRAVFTRYSACVEFGRLAGFH